MTIDFCILILFPVSVIYLFVIDVIGFFYFSIYRIISSVTKDNFTPIFLPSKE